MNERCGSCFIDNRQPWLGRAGEILDFKSGQTRIDWNRATTQLPDGQEFRKELEAVAERQKNAIAGCESVRLEAPDATRDLALNFSAIPSSTAQGLDQVSDL